MSSSEPSQSEDVSNDIVDSSRSERKHYRTTPTDEKTV